ncbi:MAG: Allantoicase [Gemmatimonadetes bacterium]|nr:Allantoicase [Gemmatimonadota bacterium]
MTGLERLNALPADEADAEMRRCCGSPEWARRMAAARPFVSEEELLDAADATWDALPPEEWLAAFRAHPRIGERKAERPQAGTAAWSAQEQAGVGDADADTRAALAEANRAYEERFGWIFLVCATGRTAGEMLASARARLDNEPDDELRVAADEQRRITRLRLEKLLTP